MANFHASAVGSIELVPSRDSARTYEFHSRPQNGYSTRIHRLDLQGLRGVSILSVLGFHFFPRLFPRGFVGVDQWVLLVQNVSHRFFVLSGYLMAKILDNGPTNIFDFYYKRSKRIVPMYVLVTLLTLWSCFFLYPESVLNLNVKSAAAALAIADDLFVHTWSLAVEVQFYLIVPVLSMLCKKTSLRISATCLIVIGVIVVYGNNLLSSRCFVHFGDISYTLYLVHWPIFCWLKLGGHCNASDRMAGALLAWFLSVLLTRTYERWYRAADKHTIVITIVILYALTGVMLVQSHNLKAFVSEHNLSLDRQIAAEYPYTNITLGIAAVNFYLTFCRSESTIVRSTVVLNFSNGKRPLRCFS
ncbi:unnamed protein product [Nippostrongylus brasiliensis]|uniref:Acyl_transf_3 domain-containing protein n=1 Tax=Nippostrongylus brasiliensis TaxID=27835 RepID=A0A158QYI5_NIPBR|nr:unnamed protein product [Nippostrongylus brasiliensis]